MGDHAAAAALLKSPETWCERAKALVASGDWRSLVDLVDAYRSPNETSKLCLLDAMEALGAKEHAGEIYGSGAVVAALELMRLFPDDAHLALLSAATDSADRMTRFTALRAIAAQFQTPKWMDAMIALLPSPRLDVRRQAIESLGKRHEDAVLAALTTQLGRETDPALRAELERLLDH